MSITDVVCARLEEYSKLVRFPAILRLYTSTSLQEEEEGDTQDFAEPGTSTASTAGRAGFATQQQIAIPRQPILQNAGYGTAGGVQVSALRAPLEWYVTEELGFRANTRKMNLEGTVCLVCLLSGNGNAKGVSEGPDDSWDANSHRPCTESSMEGLLFPLP